MSLGLLIAKCSTKFVLSSDVSMFLEILVAPKNLDSITSYQSKILKTEQLFLFSHWRGEGVSEVCGFAVRGDFLCGFPVFPKF